MSLTWVRPAMRHRGLPDYTLQIVHGACGYVWCVAITHDI